MLPKDEPEKNSPGGHWKGKALDRQKEIACSSAYFGKGSAVRRGQLAWASIAQQLN